MKIKLSRLTLKLSAVLLVLLAATALAEGDISINSTNFPDDSFRAYISQQYDLDQDGVLSEDERDGVTELYLVEAGVESIQGAEYFSGLTNLVVVNNALTSLDLSAFPNLRLVSCDGNQLTSLDTSSAVMLESLSCTQNSLTSLDLSANTELITLECYENGITALNLSACTQLESVNCSNNQLESLALPVTDTLHRLSCENNSLTSLNVSGNAELWELDVGNNSLTSLDLSHNPELEFLNVADNGLTALDLSHNPVLLNLYIQVTSLVSINLENNAYLRYLDCGWNNGITSLDVSHNPDLRQLVCCGTSVTSLDLSNNRNLRALDIHATGITEIDISNAIGLTRYMTDEYQKTARNFIVHGEFIDYTDPSEDYVEVLAGVGHDADVIFIMEDYEGIPVDADHFPDNTFRAFILDTVDADDDQLLCQEEILRTQELYATNLGTPITSLQGIECFTELTLLNCSGNQLDTLDVSYNTELRTLACFDNLLSSLDLRNNYFLESIGCSGNHLIFLDLTKQQALTSLECYDNELESLIVDNCSLLEELRCERNSLSELNLYGNPALTLLTCFGNALYNIDVSANPDLAQYVEPGHFAYNDEIIFYGEDINAEYGEELGIKCDPWTQISGADAVEVVRLNAEFFPDAQFLAILASEEYDWNQDGVLHGSELFRTDLSIDEGSGVVSLAGISFFTSLTELTCDGNPIEELSLAWNPQLEFLSCNRCALQTLDVSGNPRLTVLACTENLLTDLYVENNTALTELLCYVNRLTSLDVSRNTALVHLDCSFNRIDYLDVTHNTVLECLACEATDIQELDIRNCPELIKYVNDNYFNDEGIIYIYGIIDPDLGYLTYGLSCYANVIITGGSPVGSASVMYLPESLTVLEESAFEGTAFNIVMISSGCTTIGPRAFADCDDLRRVHIPGNGISIADTAFDGSDHVIIMTNDASIQSWATAHGIAWMKEYYAEW